MEAWPQYFQIDPQPLHHEPGKRFVESGTLRDGNHYLLRAASMGSRNRGEYARIQATRKKDAVGRTSQNLIDNQVAKLFDAILSISWREQLRAQAVCHDVSREGIHIPKIGLLRQPACSTTKWGNRAKLRHNTRQIPRACARTFPTRSKHRSC